MKLGRRKKNRGVFEEEGNRRFDVFDLASLAAFLLTVLVVGFGIYFWGLPGLFAGIFLALIFFFFLPW